MHVLEINTSARQEGSISRRLVNDLLEALEDRYPGIRVTQRDVAAGLPFVDDAWVSANFTPEEERSASDREVLALSDELVSELEAADMVARARTTFRYTENGVEGLLKGKRAFVVVPSGGVPIGSAVDFATPYLRHVLGFIGITDVEFIGAQGADRGNDEALDDARARIAELVHLAAKAA